MKPARRSVPRPYPAHLERRRPRLLVDAGDTEARYEPQPLLARLGGILALRCPVCVGSPIFRDAWHVLDKCPGCGHHHRQPVGFARIVMYAFCGTLTLAVAAAAFFGLVRVVSRVLPPQAGLESALLTALSIQLLLVPGVYRYARVLWAHLSVRTSR